MNISVIVAIYNVETYLEDCLNSLINQKDSEVEFILVDDGSTDNSSHICDKFAQKDSRIIVIHKSNGGLSDARNAGLTIARGEYIMFLDGDDVLSLKTLNILYTIAIQTNSDILQYGYHETEEVNLDESAEYDGNFEHVTDRREMYIRLLNIGGICASACTKFIKRNIIQDLEFKTGKLHEDEFFTTELLALTPSVTYITNFTPYQYLIRTGSIINQPFNSKKAIDLCEMYEARITKLRELGFDEIALSFTAKYSSILYIQYLKARFSGNYNDSTFLKNKLVNLKSIKCDKDLSFEVKMIKKFPRILLPFFYILRLTLNLKF